MTPGDVIMLVGAGVCVAYARHLWKADVAAGRAVWTPVDDPGWPHAIFAVLFGLLGASMMWLAVVELLTPGVTEIASGRFRGLALHHRTQGLMALGVAIAIGWLTWMIGGGLPLAVFRAGRRSAPAAPSMQDVPGPTVQSARDMWEMAMLTQPPSVAALALAARELAGWRLGASVATHTTAELCERLDGSEHEALRVLLHEIDRSRFGGAALDLQTLALMFEAAQHP